MKNKAKTMRRPFLYAFAAVALGLPLIVGLLQRSEGEPFNLPDRKVWEREGKPSMVRTDARDAQLNQAIGQARRELDQFIAVLQNPGFFQTGFAIKAKFSVPEHDEHIWIDPVEWREGKFVGEIANDPIYATQYRSGQVVTVDRQDVTDWEYREHGRLVGGYTKKVLANDVSPAEAAEWGPLPQNPQNPNSVSK